MWVSVSNDLRKDAERDLKDILADDIKTYPRVRASWRCSNRSRSCAICEGCMGTSGRVLFCILLFRGVAVAQNLRTPMDMCEVDGEGGNKYVGS